MGAEASGWKAGIGEYCGRETNLQDWIEQSAKKRWIDENTFVQSAKFAGWGLTFMKFMINCEPSSKDA